MASKKIRQIICPEPGYTSKSGFKCSIHDFSALLYHITNLNRTVFTKNDPVQKALFRNHSLRQTQVNKSKKWKRSFSPPPNSFREFLAIPWKVHISPGSCLISEQKNKKKRLVRSLLFLYSENIWMSPFLVAGRCHPVGVSLRIALIHSDVYFSAFPFFHFRRRCKTIRIPLRLPLLHVPVVQTVVEFCVCPLIPAVYLAVTVFAYACVVTLLHFFMPVCVWEEMGDRCKFFSSPLVVQQLHSRSMYFVL